MAEISDATKVVNYPFRPIGFKPKQGKETTVSDIKEWVRKENPSTISCLPNFAIWTGTGTILSAFLGFIGIKKDNGFCKWIGGIFGLAGIVTSGFGIMLARAFNSAPKEDKKNAPLNNNSPETNVTSQNIDETEKKKLEEEFNKNVEIMHNEGLHTSTRDMAVSKLLSSQEGFTAILDFLNGRKGNDSTEAIKAYTIEEDLPKVNFISNQEKIDLVLNFIENINYGEAMRVACAKLLGTIGDQSTIDKLQRVVDNEQSGDVKLYASLAIETITRNIKRQDQS